LFQGKERKLGKFRKARLEREEAVYGREQKRLEGMRLQLSRSKRVCKRLSQKGDAPAHLDTSKATQEAGRPGKRM
jgi:hypothetical protein